ncbi:MAG: DUF3828 domain-containing protein [Bauldia sp.]
MSITRRQFVAGASVVAIVAALPQWAFAADDAAVAFAKSLYALPGLWGDVTADDAAIKKYLDKNLGDLITANYAKTDAEAALDYDPLVQAQDFEDVKTTFTVTSESDTAAVIDAHVDNYGEDSVVTLDLTKTADGWRLANIRTDAETPSLVDELKQLNSGVPPADGN